MTRRRRPAQDQDSLWKEALEHFLASFLAFFFPHVHDAIDWSRGYESLDKELQQIVRDARVGRQLADKLFKVWRKDGREAWLLIHIEVQGKRERAFPERMFVYSYRIYDRYRRLAVSLAVLCDESPRWRPDHFEANALGCNVRLDFLTAKLLDYRGRDEELEREANPFAAVVLAQLKAQETRGAPGERWRWKVRLVKGLYDRGLDMEQMRQLLRLMDWMVQLPEELQQQFEEEMHRFEEEKRMPYLSSFERKALEKGLKEGLEKGRQEGREKGLHDAITGVLETKFGAAGKKLVSKVRALHDLAKLDRLNRSLAAVNTVEEAKELLRSDS
jgi:hypothetical protein